MGQEYMNFFAEPGPKAHPTPNDDKSTGIAIESVADADQWHEFIRWIDPLKDTSEAAAALQEFKRRWQSNGQSPLPLEARLQSERVAGAYMMLLGARVAALAGVRAIDNHTLLAVDLLNQLVREVRSRGCVQIQAILDGTDSVATEIVQRAGFAPLAELQQLALTLRAATAPAMIELPTLPAPDGLRWIAANQLSTTTLVELLAYTFTETLDCPALNGIRTPADVLDGFLDGQSLAEQNSWWVLQSQEKLIGCVFVQRLPSAAAELVYMGLGPSARGRGYGRLLLDQAILTAGALGSDMLLAAVDSGNWPATRLYQQAAFHEHARVQAWFHMPST